MANVEGTWETVTKSPLGDQNANLTITRQGDGFAGTYSGALGSVDVHDGRVEGDTLYWKLKITMPMAMTLDCEATVDGDIMAGTVTAGGFGSYPMTGKRLISG